MLQQLIDNMYVPENILENLKEDDKQLIFNLIRKEQIRRFNDWIKTLDENDDEIKPKQPNKRGKNVGFLPDNELVSFLGERPGDLSIEEKLKLEAQKLAEEKAREILEVRDDDLGVVEEIKDNTSFLEESNDNTTMKLKEGVVKVPPPVPAKPKFRAREVVENEMVKRKSKEIFQNIMKTQQSMQEQAEEEIKQLDSEFEEIEQSCRKIEEEKSRSAEEARKKIELIAQKSIDGEFAREGRENTSDEDKSDDTEVNDGPDDVNSTNSSKNGETNKVIPEKPKIPEKNIISRPPRPSKIFKELIGQINAKISRITFQSRNEAKQWFLEKEWSTGRIFNSSDNIFPEVHCESPPEWFHGIITRPETEALLRNKPAGTFLIRVSDRIPGYVLSYVVRNNEDFNIKHVLIEATQDNYQFLGTAKCSYKYISDLITFFQNNPINKAANEFLIQPQGQDVSTNQNVPDYADLLYGTCL